MDVSRFRSTLLVTGLAAAAVLVVVLASQKRDLLDRIDALSTRIRYPFPGLYLPAVALPAVAGDTVVLGQASPGRAQVLFVFATTCQYCKASLPAWKQIAAQLAAIEQVEVVGISIDSVEPTRRYLAEHGIELPVVSFTEPRLLAMYRAGTTPQTLIIDADGRVGYSHLGAVTEPLVIDSILNAATTVAARVLEGRPNAATAR
jgi:peroxiredoxin